MQQLGKMALKHSSAVAFFPPSLYTVTSLFNAPLETFCNLFGSAFLPAGEYLRPSSFNLLLGHGTVPFPFFKPVHMFTLML